jgi:hypothetical protein
MTNGIIFLFFMFYKSIIGEMCFKNGTISWLILTLQAGLMYWVRGNCVITHRQFDVLHMHCARSLSKEHICVNFCPIFKLFIQKSSKTFKLYGRVCLVCITVNSRGV